jgi:hypothetical protein
MGGRFRHLIYNMRILRDGIDIDDERPRVVPRRLWQHINGRRFDEVALTCDELRELMADPKLQKHVMSTIIVRMVPKIK